MVNMKKKVLWSDENGTHLFVQTLTMVKHSGGSIMLCNGFTSAELAMLVKVDAWTTGRALKGLQAEAEVHLPEG